MVAHISLQFHHYDIILNFILRFFFKFSKHFPEWILFIRPFWLPNCCFLILKHYFSCFIANVFFLSGPLSNPTCPTFNVQRRIPLSFHQLGKRKSSDCLSSGTAQVSPFYKVFLGTSQYTYLDEYSFSFSSNWPTLQTHRMGTEKKLFLIWSAGATWKTSD